MEGEGESENYIGYYLDDNNYVYTSLYAEDSVENRIPRLGSMLGYAQALVDFSDDTGYQVVDYIKSCSDHDNSLSVVVRTEDQSSIPSSFFKAISDAWVKMAQTGAESVHFTFNN